MLFADTSTLQFPEALLLGGLQGTTEFLPVSSSGHLALVQFFLGLHDLPLFFDVMLHVGTLAAVLFQYRRSLTASARQAVGLTSTAGFRDHEPALPPFRLAALLLLATIPAVLAVGLFRPSKTASNTEPVQIVSAEEENPSQIESHASWRNVIGDLREHSRSRPWTVLLFLTATGFVLVIGSRAPAGQVDAQSMKWYHAVGIGLAQALSALCPGLSRSGMTVSTAMLLGLRGDWAVHFSLLMSIPAILGAVVLKASELDPEWLTVQNVTATLVATATSAVVGWLCIRLLLGSVARRRWWWFSIYIWSLVATVAIVLLSRGLLPGGVVLNEG